MKPGDMIRIETDGHHWRDWMVGLLIRVRSGYGNQRVAIVLTNRGIEAWPLDSFYQFEVVNESR